MRTPRRDDLGDLLKFINSLIKENAMILMTKPITKKEEAKWLANILTEIKTGKSV